MWWSPESWAYKHFNPRALGGTPVSLGLCLQVPDIWILGSNHAPDPSENGVLMGASLSDM